MLVAIFVFGAKNKLLRESDALAYLLKAQTNTIFSAIFLMLGILGLILALFPVVYLTYGTHALIACLVISIGAIVPFSVWHSYIFLSRHTQYYYMHKARKTGSKQQIFPKNGDPSDVHNFDKPGTGGLNAMESTESSAVDRNDPYDPSIALHTFMTFAKISKILAARDSDASGVVSFDDQKVFEQLEKGYLFRLGSDASIQSFDVSNNK